MRHSIALELNLTARINGQTATIGNGTHIGLIASTKAAVHAFYETALSAGGADNGAPGSRPDYGEPYYGCFIRDLHGHKVEASFWDFSLAQNA